MIALPSYIDREAWEGFEDMRRLIKKPMTDRARKLVLYELDRLRKAGHDPNASLDQSVLHNWSDVYELKDKPVTFKTASEADKTARYLQEQAEHVAACKPLRRVA